MVTFDIKSYLNDRGITWRDGGKNISPGWIGISCVFCSETSNHLGISPDGTGFYCWVCGEKGNITKLIQKIDEVSPRIAKRTFYKYTTSDSIQPIVETRRDNFPKWSDVPLKMHLDFLKSRGYSKDVISKYNLKFTYNVGKYKYRIIAPVYRNGIIETFTGRTVVNHPEKWKHQTGAKIKKYLYNIDNIYKDSVIIVEGPGDVWKIGTPAAAIFGKDITDDQINILIRKGIKDVFIMLDSDAAAKTKEISLKLSPLFNVEEVLLESGDPGDMTYEEAEELKRMLGL